MKKEPLRIIPLLLIAAMTVILAVLFPTLPKRTFSDNENRTLAKFPALNAEKVKDGSFQAGFENYLADHFPFRDALFSLSVGAERTLGKREINGVLYLREPSGTRRLADVYEKPVHGKKFVQAVNRLSENLDTARVTLMLIPTAVTLYRDCLPAHVKARMPRTQMQLIRMITGGKDIEPRVNCRIVRGVQKTLSDGRTAGEEIFYRTDHHWTTRGAYRAYRRLAPYLGLTPHDAPGESLTLVSDSFYGTTWSKVCDRRIRPDVIEIYENPAWKGSLKVTFEDTGETTDTPYNRDWLAKKDQYSLFLDNLHPLITIENPDADLQRRGNRERRALALVKDSYANCLVPFLIDHYETIYVFDPRYYRGGISTFVNEHPEVEDVLVLYNLNTMDTDRGVGAIS